MWADVEAPSGHLTGCRVLSLGLLEMNLGQTGERREARIPSSPCRWKVMETGSQFCFGDYLLDMPILCQLSSAGSGGTQP